MSIPSDELNAALKAVFAKATTDAGFRAKCLADPAAAVKEVAGIDVPGIKFSESNEADAIALPAFGAEPDEITDAELLDGVSGGMGSMMCKSVQWCG